MEQGFLWLLNQGAAASWLILATVLLRAVFKQAPKSFRCALWALVGLRLVLPPGLASRWSLLPSAQLVSSDMLYAASPMVDTGVSPLNALVNPVLSRALAADGLTSANPAQIWSFIACCVYLAGLAALLVWAAVSCLLLRRKTAQAVCLRENVYLCDRVAAPFIFGVLRPRIYLPSDLSEADADLVLAHERAHLRRGDHLAKPAGFALLALYWFHPLVWLSYALFCRDIELACDEAVLRNMDAAYRKSYANALIRCSAPRSAGGCPLFFGEVGVKARVKAALDCKAPAAWLSALALAVCALMAVCFLTSPTGSALYTVSGDVPISAAVESPGNSYEITAGAASEYAQELLSQVRVGRAALSPDRAEDRDGTNTLTLYYAAGGFVRYHFNRACTQVWVDDGVKPTLTQAVLNPELVQQFFHSRIESPADPISAP